MASGIILLSAGSCSIRDCTALARCSFHSNSKKKQINKKYNLDKKHLQKWKTATGSWFKTTGKLHIPSTVQFMPPKAWGPTSWVFISPVLYTKRVGKFWGKDLYQQDFIVTERGGMRFGLKERSNSLVFWVAWSERWSGLFIGQIGQMSLVINYRSCPITN